MSDTERMREAQPVALRKAALAVLNLCDRGSAWPPYWLDAIRDLRAALATRRALAVPEQAPETPVWVSADALAFLRADETSVNAHVGTRLYRKGREGLVPLYAAPAALPDGKDAERQIVETVWRFIDRMTDVDDKYDPAEAIIAQFVRAVMPHLTTLGEINRAAIQAQTEGERAPSPASAAHANCPIGLPHCARCCEIVAEQRAQGGHAAANQGGER